MPPEVETPTVETPAPSLLGGAPAAAPAVEEPKPEGEQPPADTPTEEPKPEGEQPPAEEKAEEKPAGAPESYADFSVPDGFELNADLATEFGGLAKELNLPQDQAQRIIDLGVKLSESTAAAQAEGFRQLRSEWQNAARTDTEYGGEKFDASLVEASRFRDAYGTPELTELLNSTGLGDHPEMVRLFARAGKAMSDAKFVQPGNRPDTADRPLGSGFYTKSNMKD